MKTISIIIPNFNNAKWLPICLDSCLQQEGNFKKEIIIVDDHSNDDSWSILTDYKKEFPNEVFVYKNPNKGGNSARNYGFSKSSGEFIQWLDSDDSLLPMKLNTQSNYFENYPEVDMVYSDWQMDFYEDGKFSHSEIKRNQNEPDYLTYLLRNNWQANSAYLIRRELAIELSEIGLWSLTTKVGQDREYFTQAAIIGARIDFVPGVFSIYNRWSTNTISNAMDFRSNLIQNLELNQRFLSSIVGTSLLHKKQYISILNAELLNALFYFPLLKLPRHFFPWELNIKHWHWKKVFLSPLLYVWHIFR